MPSTSIMKECSSFDQEAKNATIKKVGDTFKVTDSQTGIGTDVEATKKLLLEAVGEKWDKKDVVIDAVISNYNEGKSITL